MGFNVERDFIIEQMRLAYAKYSEMPLGERGQKSKHDLVTELDYAIERFLIDAVSKRFKGDTILSEEYYNTSKISGRTWTIDPIDGTCNFAHGMRLFGVQCALLEGEEIVVSAIYLPHFNEVYSAIKGEGAFMNGAKIQVSSDNNIDNAIVSFGDYTHKSKSQALMQHRAIKYLFPRVAKIRMFGAACMDFAFTAAGKTDACVVMTKNPWDIAPGLLLAREAGAIITNERGEPYTFNSLAAIATATKELSSLITTAFTK